MSFNLLTVFIILVILSSLGLIVATISIPSIRESLVASTNLQIIDQRYLSAFLGTIAELINRLLLPVIPFAIVTGLALLVVGLPFALDIEMGSSIVFILICVVKFLAIAVPLLVAVAYLTLLERKVMASMQRRKGPNVVGAYGLLQPLADGLKLFLKESIVPASAHKGIFILSPILTFLLALSLWAAVPFGEGMVYADINIGVLYLFAVSSLGVYGVICSGWSSNTKYSFIGALRSAAQMISYEIGMGFILLLIFLLVGSLNLTDIVLAQKDIWFCVPLLPATMIWFVCILAETNRAPFDLPEAEAELVAGYFTEYSAMGFALFFLGEYSNMIMMSALTAICFFGGWYSLLPFGLGILPGPVWLGIKVTLVLFGFIWVRAAFPRYRFDQLIYLGWKTFLPFLLGYYMFVAGMLYSFDWLPN
jgi:NADH-quinone oxidoreductase subunit H